jgi:DNA polymerase
MEDHSEGFESDSANLEQIAEEIRKCRKCELWRDKRNYVPGEGSDRSGIVFVGEAPGREEDLQGRPFVGNAGKLLTELIEEKLGLRRSDVFIANVLKCRPPNNRDPLPEEIEACKPYLLRQLEILKPSTIVCLGRHSASLLFEHFGIAFSGITRMRGKPFEAEAGWGKVKLVAIYHPAAALYRPQLKEILEKDFSKLKEFVRVRHKAKANRILNKTLKDYFSI